MLLKVRWETSCFEDLDLSSFNGGERGELPLKAAVKEQVLGFRILTEVDGQPAWKRFQLKFVTSQDAATFVSKIQPYCPTKFTGDRPASTFEASQFPSSQVQPTRQEIQPRPTPDNDRILSTLYAAESEGGLKAEELEKAIEQIVVRPSDSSEGMELKGRSTVRGGLRRLLPPHLEPLEGKNGRYPLAATW